MGRGRANKVRIVGIDCAVDPRNVGLAIGSCDAEGARIEEVVDPRSLDEIVSRVVAAIGRGGATPIALDAPLGGPMGLARSLAGHEAGRPLGITAHEMARRLTDDVICEKLGRRPLDVGADRIAMPSRERDDAAIAAGIAGLRGGGLSSVLLAPAAWRRACAGASVSLGHTP